MARCIGECDTSTMKASGHRESGQAAVETALVMPLFLFFVLGVLQMGLMHQARLLAKYAAYKAARTGSLTSANKGKMENSALAAVLPMVAPLTRQTVFHIEDAQSFLTSFVEAKATAALLKPAEVEICTPTREHLGNGGGGQQGVSFDDPAVVNVEGGDWKAFDKTRLSVQVTFNYRMPIPFANMMLFWIAMGEEQQHENLMMVTRTNTGNNEQHQENSVGNTDRTSTYRMLASAGIYVVPIRASWSMRMQSDLFPDQGCCEIPQENKCKIPFPKKGGGGGGGPAEDPDP
jgi:hypothetical protein